jgi:hypothetical protein
MLRLREIQTHSLIFKAIIHRLLTRWADFDLGLPDVADARERVAALRQY